MVVMVQCPIDGCERALTDENGAVMHLINTGDDAHADVSSKADAMEKLGGWPPDDDGDDDDVQIDDDGDRVTPAIPEADDTDDGDDTEVVDCPTCGDRLGPHDEVTDAIAEHGTIYCEACGAGVSES